MQRWKCFNVSNKYGDNGDALVSVHYQLLSLYRLQHFTRLPVTFNLQKLFITKIISDQKSSDNVAVQAWKQCLGMHMLWTWWCRHCKMFKVASFWWCDLEHFEMVKLNWKHLQAKVAEFLLDSWLWNWGGLDSGLLS